MDSESKLWDEDSSEMRRKSLYPIPTGARKHNRMFCMQQLCMKLDLYRENPAALQELQLSIEERARERRRSQGIIAENRKTAGMHTPRSRLRHIAILGDALEQKLVRAQSYRERLRSSLSTPSIRPEQHLVLEAAASCAPSLPVELPTTRWSVPALHTWAVLVALAGRASILQSRLQESRRRREAQLREDRAARRIARWFRCGQVGRRAVALRSRLLSIHNFYVCAPLWARPLGKCDLLRRWFALLSSPRAADAASILDQVEELVAAMRSQQSLSVSEDIQLHGRIWSLLDCADPDHPLAPSDSFPLPLDRHPRTTASTASTPRTAFRFSHVRFSSLDVHLHLPASSPIAPAPHVDPAPAPPHLWTSSTDPSAASAVSMRTFASTLETGSERDCTLSSPPAATGPHATATQHPRHNPSSKHSDQVRSDAARALRRAATADITRMAPRGGGGAWVAARMGVESSTVSFGRCTRPVPQHLHQPSPVHVSSPPNAHPRRSWRRMSAGAAGGSRAASGEGGGAADWREADAQVRRRTVSRGATAHVEGGEAAHQAPQVKKRRREKKQASGGGAWEGGARQAVEARHSGTIGGAVWVAPQVKDAKDDLAAAVGGAGHRRSIGQEGSATRSTAGLVAGSGRPVVAVGGWMSDSRAGISGAEGRVSVPSRPSLRGAEGSGGEAAAEVLRRSSWERREDGDVEAEAEGIVGWDGRGSTAIKAQTTITQPIRFAPTHHPPS